MHSNPLCCHPAQGLRMHFNRLKRRQFMTLVGGAVVWPVAASAQQGERMRRIGVLAPLPATVFAPFFSELRQFGFIEGQTLAVDRRGFDARYDQLFTIAAEIIKAGPEALLCGGDAANRAPQTPTRNISLRAITRHK